MARLSIINEGRLVKTIQLGAGEMEIGRGDDVAIQLKHPLISRRHARLFLGPKGYVVEDQGTKNGTFVQGKRVQQHVLDDGDELEIADFILQYHSDGFVPSGKELPQTRGGMVAGDRKKSAAKSPLEAYMEALKRGGNNATAAIPPEAMAKLRQQARAKATPRLRIDDDATQQLDDRITVLGFGDGCTVKLTGRWLWVNEACRITREVTDDGATLEVERLSRICPVKVNGIKVKKAQVQFGDKIRVGKRELVILQGESAF